METAVVYDYEVVNGAFDNFKFGSRAEYERELVRLIASGTEERYETLVDEYLRFRANENGSQR